MPNQCVLVDITDDHVLFHHAGDTPGAKADGHVQVGNDRAVQLAMIAYQNQLAFLVPCRVFQPAYPVVIQGTQQQHNQFDAEAVFMLFHHHVVQLLFQRRVGVVVMQG